LCLLLRSSWLTVEGGREIGAAGVLHRRGGRAALAMSVGVAGGVPEHSSRAARSNCWRLLQRTRCDGDVLDPDVIASTAKGLCLGEALGRWFSSRAGVLAGSDDWCHERVYRPTGGCCQVRFGPMML
jgi:hypothetical protein